MGTTTPGPAADQQAVRIVRHRAAECGLAPNRIGIMGFFAGAGVTMGVALNHDAERMRTAGLTFSPRITEAYAQILRCRRTQLPYSPLSRATILWHGRVH